MNSEGIEVTNHLTGSCFRLGFCMTATIAAYDLSKRYRSYWPLSEMYVVLLLRETGSLASAVQKIHALSCNLKGKGAVSGVRYCKAVWERHTDCLCCRGVEGTWMCKAGKYEYQGDTNMCQAEPLGSPIIIFCLCSLSLFNSFLMSWGIVLLEPPVGNCSLFSLN